MEYDPLKRRITLSAAEMRAACYLINGVIKNFEEPHEFGPASTRGLIAILEKTEIKEHPLYAPKAMEEIHQTLDEIRKDLEEIPD
jgi:hypothetical protein